LRGGASSFTPFFEVHLQTHLIYGVAHFLAIKISLAFTDDELVL
jgi:hypothetical protein